MTPAPLGNARRDHPSPWARTDGCSRVNRGRKISGSVARGLGAGLGVWIVKYPSGVTAQTLVFTGANGETLQRIQDNLAGY